jgi:hypothetical protein
MEGIQSWDSPCRSAIGPLAIEFPGQSTCLSSLKLCEEQSADIAFMTDEGDKVILSTQQHTEATLLTYEHLAYKNAVYEEEEIGLVDFTMEREVVLAVEGELNEEESTEIQALLKDLGRMLQAFLTGEGASDSPPEAAGDLNRFRTISAFEAEFEYRTSVQYVNVENDQLSVQGAMIPQLAGPAEPAATSAPAAAVSNSDRVPAPAAADEKSAKTVAPRTAAELAARKMAKRVNESGLQPKRFLKRLKKFLKSFLKEMLSNHVIDTEQVQQGERILNKFINEVRKSAGGVEAHMSRASMNPQSVSRLYDAKVEGKLQPAVEETV